MKLERYEVTVPLTVDLVLHEVNEPVEYVYFPTKGLVSLQVKLSGLTREVGFVGSEGVVGANCDSVIRTSFTRSIVAVSGAAYQVPFDHLAWLLQRSPEFRELVAQSNNRICELAQQLAACNLTHQLDARLARWILQILRHSAANTVVFGTQDRVSKLLGVNRARLNEALQTLVHVGAIAHIRKGVFEVLKTDHIASLACECSSTLNFTAEWTKPLPKI